jgi:hypothetical protein
VDDRDRTEGCLNLYRGEGINLTRI